MNISTFSRIVALPAAITAFALRVATVSNAVAAAGIIGTVADTVNQNQPLLNAAVGNEKGALISLAAIALSHIATNLAAHGEPINSSAIPQVNVTATAVSTEAKPQ